MKRLFPNRPFSFLIAMFAVTLAMQTLVQGKGKPPKDDDPPPPPTPEISYSVTFLETLGGADITAYGMNEYGDIVGQSSTEFRGTREWPIAYLNRSDGNGGRTMINLQDLFEAEGLVLPFDYETGTGELVNSAYDVNDSGQILLTIVLVIDGSGAGGHTRFRYSPATTDPAASSKLEEIGTLPGGQIAQLTAINNAGVVAGHARDANLLYHAVTWDGSQGTTLTDLGFMNGQDTIPNDINDYGELCGQLNGESKPWRLSFAGFEDLGSLQRKGGAGFANSINDSGQVAGTSYASRSRTRVFRYTDGPGMKDLGTLGGDDSYGGYLNNWGDVVGHSLTENAGEANAFLYTDEFGMINLENTIDGFSGSIYYGLLRPEGINDVGEIFGTTSNGTGLAREVFILTQN